MKCFLWAFWLLLAAASLQAQSPSDPIRVWADGSSYAYFQDSSRSYVEVYCAVRRADFQFEVDSAYYTALALLYVEARDHHGVVVDSSSKLIPMGVKFLEDAYKKDVRIFEILPLLLPGGNYNIKVTAVDYKTKRSGLATFEISVRDFSTKNFMMSDLELAYAIDTLQVDSPGFDPLSSLIKANRLILPNPNRYFSNDDSLLYFYAELYNLAPGSGEGGDFEVKVTLRDNYGYDVREYPARRRHKPGTTAVLMDMINIAGITGGSYEVNVTVEDLATGNKSNATKEFLVIYNFDQLAPTQIIEGQFTQADADLMESVIKYITTKEEKSLYRDLDLEGKKNFLAQFWERKNPAPGSKVNVFKNEIFRRFAYANQYYSTSLVNRTDGWKTDRGRIYITYGQPDNIERNPSSMGQKPFEKWYYDRLPDQAGGDYCLFVDLDGYGNYRLVHATIKGEIQNPEWEENLEKEQIR